MADTSTGFSLFAQSIKRKMGWLNRLDAFSHILQDAAIPAWEKLPDEEKEQWDERARELERTEMSRGEQTRSRGRGVWNGTNWTQRKIPKGRERIRTTRNIHFRGMEEEDEDGLEDDFDFGRSIPTMNGGDEEETDPPDPEEPLLNEKHTRDKERVKEWLKDRNKQNILDLRWLFLSVQTFGRNEKESLLAEVGLNEFTLSDGVLDRLSATVADWSISNPILESRAIFHSNETHRIELSSSDPVLNKRQLLAEMLGRMEPAIAKMKNVRVGLYRQHSPSPPSSPSPPPSPSGDALIESLEGMNVKDEFDELFISVVLRRPILVLRLEFYAAKESMESFKRRERLDYDGFPTEESRFILAEAFVEAVAECLHGEPSDKFCQPLSELGRPLDPNFATPWEKGDELFCSFHALHRNSCCAAVTAARAIFIMIYSLEKVIKG